jgi:pimeloyl-ACP methyl ester carboxylesterase
MATYVLVGGAWIGGWAWQHVVRRLRANDHDGYAVTLTGLGERAHLAGPNVDLETHITDVVNVITYEDLRDVILVGHSYSGIVVAGVADRVTERIDQVVYVDSAPFADGTAYVDFYPPEPRAALIEFVKQHGDGWQLPFPGFEELGQQASLAGLGDDERRLMASKVTDQPFGTYTQPLKLQSSTPSYPRRMITCSDGGFSVQQITDALASDEPGFFAALAGPGWHFDEIHTGHWPMLSAPDELADLLGSYAGGRRR